LKKFQVIFKEGGQDVVTADHIGMSSTGDIIYLSNEDGETIAAFSTQNIIGVYPASLT
jgi:hypothetical protein